MITALAEVATVHLIVQSSTDKDEVSTEYHIDSMHDYYLKSTLIILQEHQTKQILAHLQDAHIPSHRVLHHSSNVGKIAFLRQIKPYLHVEFDDEIYNATKVHIPLLVFHPSASSNASVQKSTYLHVIDSYHDLAHVELRV